MLWHQAQFVYCSLDHYLDIQSSLNCNVIEAWPSLWNDKYAINNEGHINNESQTKHRFIKTYVLRSTKKGRPRTVFTQCESRNKKKCSQADCLFGVRKGKCIVIFINHSGSLFGGFRFCIIPSWFAVSADASITSVIKRVSLLFLALSGGKASGVIWEKDDHFIYAWFLLLLNFIL